MNSKKKGKIRNIDNYMNCNSCGQIINLSDLSQVFAHENCNGIPIDYNKIRQIEHSRSKKIK